MHYDIFLILWTALLLFGSVIMWRFQKELFAISKSTSNDIDHALEHLQKAKNMLEEAKDYRIQSQQLLSEVKDMLDGK